MKAVMDWLQTSIYKASSIVDYNDRIATLSQKKLMTRADVLDWCVYQFRHRWI